MNVPKFLGKPSTYTTAAGVIGAALVASGYLLPGEATNLTAIVGQVAGLLVTLFSIVAGAVARNKTKP